MMAERSDAGSATPPPPDRRTGAGPPPSELARVLALLDASRHSLVALAVAVDLASRRRAELVALYVEDLDLLSCAGFPFACEIGAQSGLVRPLSTSGLEAAIARQRSRIHQAVEHAVAGHELRHRLEVSRGQVVAETLAKATPGDVLVMGKAGMSERFGPRLGSTSRRLLLQAPCAVLVWDERHVFRRGPLRLVEHDRHPLEAGTVPNWLAALFDGVAPLTAHCAGELERLLARSEAGGLLLHRAQLARLLDEDPDMLARIPLPVVVVH
ncbi:universal stress protein [Billgrantia gudaonensis]|uniref:Nucleotide-binding universal stress protein, UspA family n=1 Tax=Billgrantia gudaonensis TaxID=376427 RepID=A0A1G8VH96_9GAMM|nr:universal stress protein [Halomonas gudaonensis]SDJ64530.1 Nucleotide-binding universal stress protein, UspA family [Halomonas gudaonensis]